MRVSPIVIGMGILLALPGCGNQSASEESAVAEETGTTGSMEGGGVYPTAAPSDASAPMGSASGSAGDMGTSSAGATSSGSATDAGGSPTTSGSGQP